VFLLRGFDTVRSSRIDIAGAVAKGFDTLFVASGIHAQKLDRRALQRLFHETGFTPTAVILRR
jgi:hypothetical protein